MFIDIMLVVNLISLVVLLQKKKNLFESIGINIIRRILNFLIIQFWGRKRLIFTSTNFNII